MNTRRSLDLDGLDGILPPTKKHPFAHNKKILIALLAILLALILFVFWPDKTKDAPQSNKIDDVDQTGKLLPDKLENNNLQSSLYQTEKQQSKKMQVPTVTAVGKNEISSHALKGHKAYQISFNFKLGSSNLESFTHEEKKSLTDFVDRCHNQVSIIGHTCNKGSSTFNQQLGMARANAVYQYLVDQGFDTSFITKQTQGMDKPIASNATRAGRIQNRRVEVNCLKNTNIQ